VRGRRRQRVMAALVMGAAHLGGEGQGVDGELLQQDKEDEHLEGAGRSRSAEAGVEQAQRVNCDGGDGTGER
jgi:hypothetical protein